MPTVTLKQILDSVKEALDASFEPGYAKRNPQLVGAIASALLQHVQSIHQPTQEKKQ